MFYQANNFQHKACTLYLRDTFILHVDSFHNSDPLKSFETDDSESRGQEEAGRTRQMSKLFTGRTALKFAKALNKPP